MTTTAQQDAFVAGLQDVLHSELNGMSIEGGRCEQLQQLLDHWGRQSRTVKKKHSGCSSKLVHLAANPICSSDDGPFLRQLETVTDYSGSVQLYIHTEHKHFEPKQLKLLDGCKLNWTDQLCKHFDTALAKADLMEYLRQELNSDPQSAKACLKFCRCFCKKYHALPTESDAPVALANMAHLNFERGVTFSAQWSLLSLTGKRILKQWAAGQLRPEEELRNVVAGLQPPYPHEGKAVGSLRQFIQSLPLQVLGEAVLTGEGYERLDQADNEQFTASLRGCPTYPVTNLPGTPCQGARYSCDESYRQDSGIPLNQPGGSGSDCMGGMLPATMHIEVELKDQEELVDGMEEELLQCLANITPDSCTHVKSGSIRVSITVTVATPAARAKLLHALCGKLVARCGSGGAFSITVCFMDHMVNIVKPKDSFAVFHKSEMVQCPEIRSAYFHHVQAECLVLEGYSLQGARLWAYCTGLQKVEYLTVVQSSEAEPRGASAYKGKHQTVLVESPTMLRTGGRVWLQAKHGHSISAPFMLPTLAATAHKTDQPWRRYLYTQAMLRQARMVEDPVSEMWQRRLAAAGTFVVSAVPVAASRSTCAPAGLQSAADTHNATRTGTSVLSKQELDGPKSFTRSLHQACLHWDANEVQNLLRQDADVTAQSMDGFTCLHAAAQHGLEKTVVVTYSAQTGKESTVRPPTLSIDISYPGFFQSVSYHSTGEDSAFAAESYVLDVTGRNAESDVKSVVDSLVRAGGKALLAQRSRWGHHALHFAAANHTDGAAAAKALLSYVTAADLNVKDARGCTCLHVAAQHGNVPFIRHLTAAGADVMARDYQRATPLHYAVASNAAYATRLDIWIILRSAGASADAVDSSGQTPLHWLAGACGSARQQAYMKRLLLELSTSAAKPDLLGNTPMHCAAASSKTPSLISQLAAAAPASVNARNVHGDTPLHAAAGFGNANKGVLDALIYCSSQALESGGVLGPVRPQSLAHTNNAKQTPVELAKSCIWSRQVAAYLQMLAEGPQAWTGPGQVDAPLSMTTSPGFAAGLFRQPYWSSPWPPAATSASSIAFELVPYGSGQTSTAGSRAARSRAAAASSGVTVASEFGSAGFPRSLSAPGASSRPAAASSASSTAAEGSFEFRQSPLANCAFSTLAASPSGGAVTFPRTASSRTSSPLDTPPTAFEGFGATSVATPGGAGALRPSGASNLSGGIGGTLQQSLSTEDDGPSQQPLLPGRASGFSIPLQGGLLMAPPATCGSASDTSVFLGGDGSPRCSTAFGAPFGIAAPLGLGASALAAPVSSGVGGFEHWSSASGMATSNAFAVAAQQVGNAFEDAAHQGSGGVASPHGTGFGAGLGALTGSSASDSASAQSQADWMWARRR